MHVSSIADLEMTRKRSDSEIVGALTTEKPNGVSSLGDPGENISGWRCVELLVDSGAVDNVADPKEFPEYPIEPSDGSRAGMYYIAANKGMIQNQGEQHLLLMSLDESHGFRIKMQSAEVSRPILSVIRLGENGNDVFFRQDGGTIKNRESGQETHFARKHGIFILKVWLRTSPPAKGMNGTAAAPAGFARRA